MMDPSRAGKGARMAVVIQAGAALGRAAAVAAAGRDCLVVQMGRKAVVVVKLRLKNLDPKRISPAFRKMKR